MPLVLVSGAHTSVVQVLAIKSHVGLWSSHLRLSVLVVVCWSRELTPPSSKCWLQQTQGLADRLAGRLGKHCHCAPTRAKGSHPLSFGCSLAFSKSSHLPLTHRDFRQYRNPRCACMWKLRMRNTHGAKKEPNYAGIMLLALKGQLCSKLCWHNIRTPTARWPFRLCTSLASRPMTVVFGLGTRLRVRMRTKLKMAS